MEEGLDYGSSFLYNDDTLTSTLDGAAGVPSPTSVSGGGPGAAWFAGLRSKLASFSMGDWLSQLGIARSKATADDQSIRSQQPSARRRTQARATSLGPLCTSADDVDVATPTDSSCFWLNLEPGGARPHYEDTLELQHFGPLEGLVPIGQGLRQKLGEGHLFEDTDSPTWCDKCGDFIWGFYKVAVRCSHCNYTCHIKCRKLVTLDCRSVSDSIKSASTVSSLANMIVSQPMDTSLVVADNECVPFEIVGDPFEQPDNTFVGAALQRRIAEFNDNATGMSMTIEENNSFSGYIPIHMNFTRPINVVAGERPPSVYDCVQSAETIADHRTIASFFLPRNTVKVLHVDSETTTRQLIVTLLRKFKIADNPRKFALYSRTYEENNEGTLLANLQRIADDAFVLKIALVWGADTENKFVLQENETGDILWEAFAEPELNNFMRILKLEEEHYLWQLRQRYTAYRYQLQAEMQSRRASGFHQPLNPADPFGARSTPTAPFATDV